MARGYVIDPSTGLPAITTTGGGLLPLPVSPDDMSLAGAQLQGPPGAPSAPPVGPDLRVAGPGGGAMDEWGPADPMAAAAQFAPPPAQEQAAYMRAALGAPASTPIGPPAAPPPAPSHGAAPTRFDELAAMGGKGSRRGGVDPSTLARPGVATQQQAAPTGPASADGASDPLVNAAMAEYMSGPRGAGGPARMGVTGETRKFRELGAVPAEVSQGALDTRNASDGYNEQLAKSLKDRQQQGYDAYQGEQMERVGQLQAQRERFEEQQRMLLDYKAKRDALQAEAAQMKVPQMEDYWGSKSTMVKLATNLSIALGGALQGLRGGQNPGLEASNQEIERWIGSQREAYARAKGRVDDADNQYARMVQNFGSRDLAETHLREQAWTVRDGMLKAYAEKVGTPNALEAYNQAQLQLEAQRAALQQQAYQQAGADIEQKISMQGGGGGKPRTIAEMVATGAKVKKDIDTIRGKDDVVPDRAIEGGKAESLTASIETINAADAVIDDVHRAGYGDSDADDPLSGGFDYVSKNIPGTQARALNQRLQQNTTRLARGIQQSLGKSDNDAKLADQMAAGGGSGRERIMAAQTAKERARANLRDQIASMTPAQRAAFVSAQPPERRQVIESVFGAQTAPAASERRVE